MNKEDLRLNFMKGDIAAIAFVAALAVTTALAFHASVQSAQGAAACIYQDGQLLYELPLREDRILVIEGEYRNQLQVHQGRIGIIASDCPGADCVHSGSIGEPGRSIFCLPNHLEIRIAGASEVDFVVK